MKKMILLLIISLAAYQGVAQKSSREVRGDSFYETFSFIDAIDQYLRVRSLSEEGQRRLADSFRRTGQYQDAERIYEKFINTPVATADDLFKYASVLRSNGKYPESNLWMERFHRLVPNDTRGLSFIENVANLDRLLKDQGQFNIKKLRINTEEQEFGPAYYGNQVVFSSTRKPVQFVRRYSGNNHRPFLDLYLADIDGFELKNPRPFYQNRVNNKWHEGPASFARDRSLMAFTRSNYKASSIDGTIKLEIYFSEKDVNGNWSDPVPFKLNNPDYSVAHPFLTEDGNAMYFSSDMPGGKGGADIYRITRNRLGIWGQPVNLGKAINTEGDEFFPFFHQGREVLFFSSNGHMGLGGLDVFMAPQLSNGEYSYSVNAGAPINTRFDDFSFIIDEGLKSGYFASNRQGGSGDDDIYFFELLKPFIFGKVISGTIKDQKGNIIPGAEMNLIGDHRVVQSALSSEAGKFEFIVETEREWLISGKKNGFFNDTTIVSTILTQDLVTAELILEIDPNISLFFSVIDRKSRQPLINAKIEFTNKMTKEKEVFHTAVDGIFELFMPEKRLNDYITYEYRIEAPGYLVMIGDYSRLLDKVGRYNVFEELGLNFIRIREGETRLEEIVNLKKIEFDTYRHTLRAETTAELEKVIDIMKENPTMTIEIGNHTDCRGSTQLNQQLSERRAQSMAEYIRARISNPRRVTFKGHGRTILVNECDCFVIPPQFCTEEQHAENRRTEFIIVKM